MLKVVRLIIGLLVIIYHKIISTTITHKLLILMTALVLTDSRKQPPFRVVVLFIGGVRYLLARRLLYLTKKFFAI